MKPLIFTVLLTTLIALVTAQEATSRFGEFTITSTILALMGETNARTYAEKISITEPVEWEVYVPENYDPAMPAGVLVFINSRNSGKIEQQWKTVMDRHNLIWIGANNSGNEISIAHRVAFAIVAPRLLSNTYNLNPERIYISGFSGGSRVASMVATEYNNLFKGAIYNSGANYWGDSAKQRYEEMKNNNYVFITGTEDFNLEDTREVYSAYQNAGINNTKLMIIPDMSHERPDPGELGIAIEYLDSR